MNSIARRALTAVALLAAVSSSGFAQSNGPRWAAWNGCWSDAVTVADSVPADAAVVCISPTANADVVQFTTVADGKIVATDSVDGSGRERAISAKNCSGTQRGQWSSDQRRLFLKSAVTCEGVASSSSAILAIGTDGEWLDVRGVSAGGGQNVRVARYDRVASPKGLPADVATVLAAGAWSSYNARVAAGAPINTDIVIEASKQLVPAMVEAWLLELGHQFALDAKELVALSKAGVPSRVIDAMVAVSNPQRYAITRTRDRVSRTADSSQFARRRANALNDPMMDVSSRLRYNTYGSGYGYDSFGPYGGYGYSPYSYRYGYYGTGYYSPGVVIITTPTNNNRDAAVRGQVVNGRGYTQNRPPTPEPSPSESPRSTAASSSSTSSSGSSSSGGSDRTAKARQ